MGIVGIESLEDAREFADAVRGYKKVDDVSLSDLVVTLQFLADAKDASAFKKMCDAYAQLEQEKGEEPMVKIEWLCMGLDHGFAAVNYAQQAELAGTKDARLPVKGTQKFFQEMYGSRFYRAGQ